ncbi:MAG: hypothetical protein ABFC84_15305 [Veillonellales bacterium]
MASFVQGLEPAIVVYIAIYMLEWSWQIHKNHRVFHNPIPQFPLWTISGTYWFLCSLAIDTNLAPSFDWLATTAGILGITALAYSLIRYLLAKREAAKLAKTKTRRKKASGSR